MTDHLISQRFDDIYFSRQDGLAETDHVFLNGNDLPERLSGRTSFTIAETGFGTGLNFLSAWRLFDQIAPDGAVLDYISFEQYPLSRDVVAGALSHWGAHFGGRLEQMLAQWPLRVPGWHRIDFTRDGKTRVRLTLIHDDVNLALPRLCVPCGVDAWFLDGFAPAKNPDMWTDALFGNMARLSVAGAGFATFTAAGRVRDGLRAAGFDVVKTRGFGRKRDMLVGRYAGAGGIHETPKHLQRVAIIGGGLAGAACARALRLRGVDHVIFDAADSLATGASGNMRGIFNPRFSAHRTAQSDFYNHGFAAAAGLLRRDGFDLNPCGSLHLITDQEKDRRLQSCLSSWGWHDDHMRLLTADQASDLAGVPIRHSAPFLPDSGQTSPRALCESLASGSTQVFSTPYAPEMAAEFDRVIYACAGAVRDIDGLSFLPVQTVRGQIITVNPTAHSASLKVNLCYGGYLGAAEQGQHVIGASFQPWRDDCTISDEDTNDILARLDHAVPGLGFDGACVTGARASLRCASQDRFPVIGAVPDREGHFVSAAHGSHGIISALSGADMLADLIMHTPASLPQDSINALSPQRFIDRAQRRGQKTP